MPATLALLLLNGVVFVAQLVVALRRSPSWEAILLGGTSVDVVRFGAMPLGSLPLALHEPWRALSAMFVHIGVVHLALNMSALFYLGRMAEPAIGAARFVLVYLLTGLGGFLASLVYSVLAGQHALTAGASGALFGLTGLVLGILLRRRDPRWKAWATQAVLFGLMFGFAVKVANNSAHLGGVAIGLGCGLVLGRDAPRPAARWQNVLAALGLAASVASLVAAQLSPLWRLLEDVLTQ